MAYRKPNERVFKIIIPKTGDREDMEDVADEMTKRFGGVTIFPFTIGYWRDPTGKVVYDDNYIIESVRTVREGEDHIATYNADWKFMHNLADIAGSKFNQQEVMIEQDIIRGAEFVKPDIWKYITKVDLPRQEKRLETVI
jgi:hypothetical protein